MRTRIFYFTGTGNSLCIAKRLAEELGNATLEPVTRADPVVDDATDAVGIFFPVYGWGMPNIVAAFVDKLENCTGKYVFAVCTYGGTLFASLRTIQRGLRKKGIDLAAGFGFRMPVNYIPMFTVLSPEKREKVLKKAFTKVGAIAPLIKERKKAAIETWKVPVINGLLLSMHGPMMAHVNEEDRKFVTDTSCDGCGVCAKVCPVRNVTLAGGRPVWNHSCQECLACLHWCPKKAINFGNTPEKRGRYHNPEVSLQEIMDQQVAAG